MSLSFLYTFTVLLYLAQANTAITASSKLIHLGTFKAKGVDGEGKEFYDHNYYASAGSAYWVTANRECYDIFGGNASLLAIETEEEYDWINNYLRRRGVEVGVYWTSGLYDLSAGVWRWGSNPEANFNDFTAWGVGHPSSTNSRQRVAVNFRNFSSVMSTWESHDDAILNKYICEVPVVEEIPEEGKPKLCYTPHSVIIALDSSSSLGPENYALAKAFASEITSAFTVANGKQFGVINYSLFPTTEVHLSQSLHSTPTSNAVINSIYQNYTQRNTHTAMQHAFLQLDEFSHDGIAGKEMIVLTNGISEIPSITRDVAAKANAAGIRTYAIGLSFSNPGSELLNIAGGNEDRVFQAEWDNLDDLLRPLSELICDDR